MFGFITKREHDEIVAAKDAEIAVVREARRQWFGHWSRANSQCAAHEYTISALRAELAASYVRNERGQIARHPSFRPTVRAGDMGEVVDAWRHRPTLQRAAPPVRPPR